MRRSTLNFYIFIKIIEMILMVLFSTLIISSGVWLIEQVSREHEVEVSEPKEIVSCNFLTLIHFLSFKVFIDT